VADERFTIEEKLKLLALAYGGVLTDERLKELREHFGEVDGILLQKLDTIITLTPTQLSPTAAATLTQFAHRKTEVFLTLGAKACELAAPDEQRLQMRAAIISLATVMFLIGYQAAEQGLELRRTEEKL